MASESLIYADESLINIPGDAVVTVTWEPSSCYVPDSGDYNLLVSCLASWGEVLVDDPGHKEFELPLSAIASGDALTLSLLSFVAIFGNGERTFEHCPETTARITVQQVGTVGLFTTEVPLEVFYFDYPDVESYATIVTIQTAGNRITGVGA